MSVTSTYTAMNRALIETARRFRPLSPFDVRVILATWERGRSASLLDLADDLGDREGAGVRRSRSRLCGFDYATRDGEGRIKLTAAGRSVGSRFYSELDRQQRAAVSSQGVRAIVRDETRGMARAAGRSLPGGRV